jgi:hypothetical protein
VDRLVYTLPGWLAGWLTDLGLGAGLPHMLHPRHTAVVLHRGDGRAIGMSSQASRALAWLGPVVVSVRYPPLAWQNPAYLRALRHVAVEGAQRRLAVQGEPQGPAGTHSAHTHTATSALSRPPPTRLPRSRHKCIHTCIPTLVAGSQGLCGWTCAHVCVSPPEAVLVVGALQGAACRPRLLLLLPLRRDRHGSQEPTLPARRPNMYTGSQRLRACTRVMRYMPDTRPEEEHGGSSR